MLHVPLSLLSLSLPVSAASSLPCYMYLSLFSPFLFRSLPSSFCHVTSLFSPFPSGLCCLLLSAMLHVPLSSLLPYLISSYLYLLVSSLPPFIFSFASSLIPSVLSPLLSDFHPYNILSNLHLSHTHTLSLSHLLSYLHYPPPPSLHSSK